MQMLARAGNPLRFEIGKGKETLRARAGQDAQILVPSARCVEPALMAVIAKSVASGVAVKNGASQINAFPRRRCQPHQWIVEGSMRDPHGSRWIRIETSKDEQLIAGHVPEINPAMG